MRISNSIEKWAAATSCKTQETNKKTEYLVNKKKVIQFADNQGKVC